MSDYERLIEILISSPTKRKKLFGLFDNEVQSLFFF